MSSRLRQLEDARHEILSYSGKLDQKVAAGEINTLEYKILLSEKLRGKAREDLMRYIDHEISAINERQRSQARIRMAIAITAVAIIIALIAAVGLDNHATGFAVSIEKTKEQCQSEISSGHAGEKILSEEKARLDPVCSRLKEQDQENEEKQ
jgi:hypothetical protein